MNKYLKIFIMSIAVGQLSLGAMTFIFYNYFFKLGVMQSYLFAICPFTILMWAIMMMKIHKETDVFWEFKK